VAKCPLASIEIGNESCPNKKCMWNTRNQQVKNNCIAIHEPQYAHLTVEELSAFKEFKETSTYVTKAKHLIQLMVLFAEYVEYVRDNAGSCKKKLPSKKYRQVFKIKELSINKNLAPLVAHPGNYERFYQYRKPVLKVEFYKLLSMIGENV
jgi:hypothetical protein